MALHASFNPRLYKSIMLHKCADAALPKTPRIIFGFFHGDCPRHGYFRIQLQTVLDDSFAGQRMNPRLEPLG